jgi:hypothetical protein
MKPADLRIALACAAFAGGAFAAPSPDRVPVYDATQIAHDSYVVIERIGVESWRSAFGIGGHRDEAGARSAVLAEAARVRADGVVNLHCLGQTDGLFNSSGFYCYGNAIRLKNERRVGSK